MIIAEKLNLEPAGLAERGKTLALETLRHRKHCAIFVNIDIHAYRGEEIANLNDQIKEIMISFDIFKRGF